MHDYWVPSVPSVPGHNVYASTHDVTETAAQVFAVSRQILTTFRFISSVAKRSTRVHNKRMLFRDTSETYKANWDVQLQAARGEYAVMQSLNTFWVRSPRVFS